MTVDLDVTEVSSSSGGYISLLKCWAHVRLVRPESMATEWSAESLQQFPSAVVNTMVCQIFKNLRRLKANSDPVNIVVITGKLPFPLSTVKHYFSIYLNIELTEVASRGTIPVKLFRKESSPLKSGEHLLLMSTTTHACVLH